LHGAKVFEDTLAPYRKTDGTPDCLVSLSGGRDSCYTLHYVKTVLKMNPVAYTFDWGMVTDLGRRNQARMCGKLGVEHILVSADITQKRKNIQRNVTAWLNRPHLGMVPLFMAGDKQYFHFAQEVKSQTGTQVLIMGENFYEKTNFKTGFCGVPETRAKLAYVLPFMNKLKLAAYYASQILQNPGYVNPSLLDSFRAFFVYYWGSHEYVNIFEYLP